MRGMKILLTLPRPIFPTNTGGRIRVLNIFSRLASRIEVHALSFADREDESSIREMRQAFHSYTPVFWRETRKFSPAFYAELLQNRFSRFPYFLAKYRLPAYSQAAENLFARHGFDLLFCDGLASATALLDASPRPRVLFNHNVESVILEQHAETAANPLRRLLYAQEAEKARRIEGEVCRKFDHVLTVSDVDRDLIVRDFGAGHVTALPTGVDADYFRSSASEPQPGNLVFVGSMDWHPNEDGIFWFVREVYPAIRQAAPHATLSIVGRDPSARLRALAARDASIQVTGTVPDVRPLLQRAEVVVVPLRIGSGTRIKIFEAMAMGRPVVSTTLGAEGLPLAPGTEILLEDSPRGFARAVVELLGDSGRRAALARAAREKVLRDHTWDSVAVQLTSILERVVADACRGVAPAPASLPQAAVRAATESRSEAAK